jgi:cell division protein FtsX
MSNLLARADRRLVGALGFVVVFAGLSAPAWATSPTYDITPVVSGVTSDLTTNLPIILAAVGALIALVIAVRAVRKFMHV